MLVVSEVEETYLPLPLDTLVVQVGSHRPAINAFLESLEMLFEGSRKTSNCLGSVLKAFSDARSSGAGSLLVFQTTLPNIGQGALVKTGGVSLLGTSKEYKLLNDKSQFYKNLTLSLNGNERSVDFFIFNADFDLPSVAPLARNTGGLVFYYPRFWNESPDSLFRDLEVILSRKALSVNIRNVVPRGLFVSGISGRLTQIASSASFGATINYGDSLYYVCEFDERMIYFDISLGNLACFQAIIEYLDSQGRRLIRVINYSLPTTGSLNIIHASLDAATYVAHVLRQQVRLALQMPMDRIRSNLKDYVTTYLGQHFKLQNANKDNLLVPYRVRTLPYLIHAALKHPSFQSGAQVLPNDRIISHQSLMRLSPELIVNLLCPPLLQLPLPEASLSPSRHNLSSEKISRPGIFFLDLGCQLWCWVANGVDNSLLKAYFNVDSYSALPTGQVAFASLPPLLFHVVSAHFSCRPHVFACPYTVVIIKEADPSQAHWRQAFLSRLVEDQNQL
ncbi:COPII subunit, partial [Massospora cicadina]